MRKDIFQKTVWDFYLKNGRGHLPWRKTNDPYKILVSELMLQQTQVDRVVPKYNTFVKKWPTVTVLAKAPLSEVIKAWQGLGYNRRAKFLHETAKAVTKEYKGKFPKTEEELRTLPGVGPYTAKAICAFAYNQPVVLIETNVRQVFIYHFFSDKRTVTDNEILTKVATMLPGGSSCEWYAALMDYGTHLKKVHGNLARKSASYTKQKPFKGSDREIRGAVLREVGIRSTSPDELSKKLSFTKARIDEQVQRLLVEGLLVTERGKLCLPR